jgi:hypothetical protein
MARVSPSTVSRIERGQIESLATGLTLRVAAALEIRLEWTARWRGGELDRMLNAGHATMHEVVARMFSGASWRVVPEMSFSIYGERGVIDLLAFHPPTSHLLVVELKTQLVDVQGLIGTVDRYRRLAPQIARERGWSARATSCWVLLRDTPTNHRRLADHANVLRTAFPDDGRRLRGWLREPGERVDGLSFLSDPAGGTAIAASAGVQRVRRRRLSVAHGLKTI